MKRKPELFSEELKGYISVWGGVNNKKLTKI